MPQLSIVMIVKNEECFLEECLLSVKDIADEIVIVDTGSVDKTIEIAQKFDAQIYNFEWINDFSAARNFALAKATGNWILYLDADERMDSNSLKEIERIKTTKDNAGYFCTVKSIDCENNRDNSMRYIRLFRNMEGIKFVGKVHEQISASLTKKGAKLFNSKILINHLGYNISKEEKRKKALRNLQILEEEYNLQKSGYYAYQLANTYFILNDTENCNRFFQLSAESKELSKAMRAECYSNLALFAHKEFDTQKALNLIQKSLELNKEQPFTHLLISKIYLQGGNKAKSEEYCKNAFSINQKVLQNQIQGEIQIYLDNEEIIWYGMLLAFQTNNRDNLNFYLKECKNHYQNKNVELSGLISGIVEKFLVKDAISALEEKTIISSINRNTSEFFLELIEKNLSSMKENFIERIYDKYRTDLSFIKIYSLYYSEHNDLEKAINILEENSEQIKQDPSAILYLISYYLSLGNFKKVEKWIEIMENNFNRLPQITSIINNLKEKILVNKKN